VEQIEAPTLLVRRDACRRGPGLPAVGGLETLRSAAEQKGMTSRRGWVTA
jgi:hypothetical protein